MPPRFAFPFTPVDPRGRAEPRRGREERSGERGEMGSDERLLCTNTYTHIQYTPTHLYGEIYYGGVHLEDERYKHRETHTHTHIQPLSKQSYTHTCTLSACQPLIYSAQYGYQSHTHTHINTLTITSQG